MSETEVKESQIILEPVSEFRRRGEMVAIEPTPMQIIARAVQDGADVERLGALMALQERYDANEARKAFNAAFTGFKSEAVKIIRTTDVKDGPLKGKKYADKYAIVSAVTTALSKHGLSASWRLTKDERDWMEVTCTLRHSAGHAEQVSMGGPPDIGPGRNAIQARSSTNSYLEKITLKAICGLAESGDDDDGRGGKKGMDAEVKVAWQTKIDACANTDEWAALWEQITEATTKAGDVTAHEELRALMAAKRKALMKPKAEPKGDL